MDLKIKMYGDPILRQKAKPVKDKNSKRVRQIVKAMTATCKQQDGLGLAAPQVGILERIIIIDMTYYGGEIYVMINPEIISNSNEKFYTQEGCLSIPGIYAEVMRPKESIVQWVDCISGKKKEIRATGILNTIIHHEIDHLDGILFIDRIDDESFKNQILASLTLKSLNS